MPPPTHCNNNNDIKHANHMKIDKIIENVKHGEIMFSDNASHKYQS